MLTVSTDPSRHIVILKGNRFEVQLDSLSAEALSALLRRAAEEVATPSQPVQGKTLSFVQGRN